MFGQVPLKKYFSDQEDEKHHRRIFMSSFDTNNILKLTHTTPGVGSGTILKLFFGTRE